MNRRKNKPDRVRIRLQKNVSSVCNVTIATVLKEKKERVVTSFLLFAVYFDSEMDLVINTSSCKMTWASDYEYPGNVEKQIFNTTIEKGKEITEHFEVCKIEFTSTIFIGSKVRVRIDGYRALSLISTHGNIEINSPLNISGVELPSVSSSVGGYVKTSGDGLDAGKANNYIKETRIEFVNSS